MLWLVVRYESTGRLADCGTAELTGCLRQRRSAPPGTREDGQHPFPDSRPMIDVPVTDPRTTRPDLHPDLAGFLIKACAPVSLDRFATAADMRTALRTIRAGL